MIIYIIILHYGNIKDTIACLESIAKLKKVNLQIKVLLVDNNSGSVVIPNLFRDPNKMLKQVQHDKRYTDSDIEIIQNNKNLGFAGGINIGIKEALKDKNADYILILNNDTILPKNFFEKILDNPSDITSPVIKFKYDSNWVYDYGGKINWWTGRIKHIETNSKLPACAGRKTQNSKQIDHIDYVSGCCMLVKREVFEKIGLFDERFFFYFEDVDLCIRAQKAGFRISVCKNAIIYHKLGASIGRWSSKAILYNLYGNLIFITKHLGFRKPIGYLYLLMLAVKIFFNLSFPRKRESRDKRIGSPIKSGMT